MHRAPTTSLWHDTMPHGEWDARRRALPGDADFDEALVGGGYTGLWTAYHLARHDPSMRIVVLESETVGFGASGRNGGWCSALLPMSLGAIAADHGRDAARRFQVAMNRTVDEIAAVVDAEGIDCHFVKGGSLHIARSTAQASRVQHEVEAQHDFGFTDDDVRWMSPPELSERAGVSSVHGAAFTPHCAAVHPARLVRGLAHAVERLGVTIHEDTGVQAIGPRIVRTEHGTVRATTVVRATEAFTVGLPGMRRTVAPIYSLMIATEPLPADVLEQVGIADRATFDDARRLVIYGQRTADGRIAFGGRGAPYHWRSGMRAAYEHDDNVHDGLRATLCELFPVLNDAAITHRWGGAVAAPRDWWCSVGLDRATGLAWAGGYVGDGVATSHLAGRTLTDLITGTASPLTELPWVDHRSRSWEVEPLRWLGINAMVRLTASADRHETRTGTADRWRGALIERITHQS
ncbi:MAG: FAD-dependent oxidoreductase [Ilumatobacteraceae bacterium]